LQVVDEYIAAGKSPSLSLYMTLIESLLQRCTPVNMASAKRLLDQMKDRGFFLNSTIGSNFLFLASLDREGDYEAANTIWDMMQNRNQRPSVKSLTAYSNGLQLRKVPEDDVRLAATREIIAKIQKKNNWVRGVQTGMANEGDQEQEHGDHIHVAADRDEATMQDHVVVDHDAEDQSSEHVAEDESSEHIAEDQSSEHVAEDEHVAAVGESRTPPSG